MMLHYSIYFSFPVVLETNQIVMSMPKQLDAAVAHDLMWKLNCIVWASVDQQDRKKPYAKADSHAMREHSLQASRHFTLCLLVTISSMFGCCCYKRTHRPLVKHWQSE